MDTTESLTGNRVSGRRITWVVVLLAISVLLNYVDRGAIGIAAPLMMKDLDLSATGFGIAVSAFFWIYAPICLFVGWLCDRFCVYRMFAFGLALWAISTILTGFVGGLAALIVLRLMLGLGESIAFPGSSKIFAAEVPSVHRGMANAAIAAALAFGPAVGTLAGGTILEAAGWRPIFWIFGLVTLLWLLPWHFVSAPLRSKGIATPRIAPVPMKTIASKPALWKMGVAHFTSNYGFYFLLAWLPLFLVRERGLGITDMTILTTIGFATQGVVSLASGRLSDMLVARGMAEGQLRRYLMVVAQFMAAMSIAGLAVADSFAAIAALQVLAGTAAGIIAVNIFAVGQIFAGPRAAGGWIGLQNAIGNLSGILGPILTGLIVDYLGGYGWAFGVSAAIAIVGALWWWLVIPPIEQAIDD
ncbi:MAG: MFS transporter [Pontixanthobacter sp.]